jgi:hypothetical protein
VGDIAARPDHRGVTDGRTAARPDRGATAVNDRAAAWSNGGAAAAAGDPHLGQVCGRTIAGFKAEGS